MSEATKVFRSVDPVAAAASYGNWGSKPPETKVLPEEDLEDYTETDDDEVGVYDEQAGEDETPFVDESEFEEEQAFRTQEDFDNAIKRRLKRQERSIAKQLGVSLEEARELIEAGRLVAEASGLTPAQIKMKLEESRMNQSNVNQGQPVYRPVDDEVKREIAEVRSMLTEEREEKARTLQESEAKKEFGDLYLKHQDAIEDKAEELGLSLLDAAAVVLRPKLREIAEERVANKQQVRKSRKIEGSDEGAGATPLDLSAVLGPQHKKIARKMGLTLERYYQRGKETGLF